MSVADVTIAQLWRYPVKSLQGEQLTNVEVVVDGLDGDRTWGICDLGTGRVLTARRAPELLEASAALGKDGTPVITVPDGRSVAGPGPGADAALSEWLGRAVSLVSSAQVPPARAEYFADATDDTSEAIEWTMPPGRFVDAMPILILTAASLRAGAALHPAGQWDIRRFRPNVVLDVAGEDFLEDTWCHRALRCGTAEIVPRQGCIRCTMVTRAQPGLGRDLDVYRALARSHGGTFGVWSEVTRGGSIAVGDVVQIADG